MRFAFCPCLLLAFTLPLLWAAPGAAAEPGIEADWSPMLLDASIYPSQRTAARQLVIRWARQLEAISPRPQQVEIECGGGVCPSMSDELCAVIQRELPEVDCVVRDEKEPSSVAAGRPVVRARLAVTGDTSGGGRLSLTSPGSAPVLVDYVEKPWADDVAGYVAAQPRGIWVIGQSGQPCTSRAQASRQAIESAVSQLLPAARTRTERLLNDRSPGRETRLRTRLEAELPRWVSDRFAQSFPRSYVELWREMVLVDISEGNLEQLAAAFALDEQRLLTSERTRKKEFAWTVLSAAGLLLVVYLVYLLANTLSRGYFVWSLRTIAVVVALVGVMILFALVGQGS